MDNTMFSSDSGLRVIAPCLQLSIYPHFLFSTVNMYHWNELTDQNVS